MNLPIPTEAEEAKMFVAWLRIHGYKFMHIPSETGGSPEARRRAVRMKQQGTSRGFPDYLIIKGTALLSIELKRRKKSLSRVDPEQREWLQALAATGVHCAICYGCAEAAEFVESINPGMTPALPAPSDDLPF